MLDEKRVKEIAQDILDENKKAWWKKNLVAILAVVIAGASLFLAFRRTYPVTDVQCSIVGTNKEWIQQCVNLQEAELGLLFNVELWNTGIPAQCTHIAPEIVINVYNIALDEETGSVSVSQMASLHPAFIPQEQALILMDIPLDSKLETRTVGIAPGIQVLINTLVREKECETFEVEQFPVVEKYRHAVVSLHGSRFWLQNDSLIEPMRDIIKTQGEIEVFEGVFSQSAISAMGGDDSYVWSMPLVVLETQGEEREASRTLLVETIVQLRITDQTGQVCVSRETFYSPAFIW